MKSAVLFVELPQFGTFIDNTLFDGRELDKVLLLDKELVAADQVEREQQSQFKSIVATDLWDQASLASTCKELSQSHNFVAVLGCSETSVLPAAYLADALSVRSIGVEVAEKCRNKHSMIQALSGYGVTCPDYFLANRGSAPQDIALALGGYPLVCKPLMGFSSFGVIRVDSDAELQKVLRQVARSDHFIMGRYYGLSNQAGLGQLLVQSYVPGREVAVDGYVQNGTVSVLSVIDKPDVSSGPYFDDRIHVLPSCLEQTTIARIAKTAQSCVAALKLDNSPFHIEMRIDGEAIVVLEVAARIGLVTTLWQASGIDLLAVTLALKLGEPPPVQAQWNRYAGSVCLSPERQGTFVGVENLEAVAKSPHISAVRLFVDPGQRVSPPPNGTGYIGIINAAADNYSEVYQALQRGRDLLKLNVS